MAFKFATLASLLLVLACVIHRRNESADPQYVSRDLLSFYDAQAHTNTLLLRFDPPVWYDTVATQIQQCSGRAVPRDLEFYVAQREALGVAVAFHVGTRIVFGLGYEMNRRVVAHEMLHHATADITPSPRPGESNEDFQQRAHQREYFHDRCGMYVED